MRLLWLPAAALLACAACGPKTVSPDELDIRTVGLPNGKKIRAEEETRPILMGRGMMFRDSLAPDRGMLFVHTRQGKYPYWMYQTRIPLDIIWIDQNHRIVEIYPQAPPCPGPASKCPSYGGHADALFVLELAGGEAGRNGLKAGDYLSF